MAFLLEKTFQKAPALTIEVHLDRDHFLDRCFLHDSSIDEFRLHLSCPDINHPHVQQILLWLELYSQGVEPNINLPFRWSGFSPFRVRLYQILHNLPFGHSISYGELAERSGHPRAARAAGSACKHNPFPLFVPCHRVLAHNNQIGGFACGLALKHKLLSFEQISWHGMCV